MFTAFELCQLACKFDALSFAAGEDRGRMAEREVSQSEVIQDRDLAGDRRLILEELDAFFNRQIQDLGNALPSVFDFQRVLVVTRTFAGRTQNFDVGHERELRRDRSFPACIPRSGRL